MKEFENILYEEQWKRYEIFSVEKKQDRILVKFNI